MLVKGAPGSNGIHEGLFYFSTGIHLMVAVDISGWYISVTVMLAGHQKVIEKGHHGTFEINPKNYADDSYFVF